MFLEELIENIGSLNIETYNIIHIWMFITIIITNIVVPLPVIKIINSNAGHTRITTTKRESREFAQIAENYKF